jgi:transposase
MPRPLGYKRRDVKKLEARRFAAMARFRRGESTSAVARSLGVGITSVQRWVRSYRLRGKEGLRRLPKSGRRPKLPVKSWLGFPDCWRKDRQPLATTRPSGHRNV